MNIKIFWILQAIALTFFGLGMLLVPELFWGIYGATLVGAGVYITRGWGVVLIGNAILSWQVRDESQSAIMQTLVTVFLFEWLVVLVIFLIAQIDGMLNALMWANLVLSLFWTVVWGYFRFVKKSPAVA